MSTRFVRYINGPLFFAVTVLAVSAEPPYAQAAELTASQIAGKLKNPKTLFRTPRLQTATPVLQKRGKPVVEVPIVIQGGTSWVIPMHDSTGKKIAVRCLMDTSPDQTAREASVCEYIAQNPVSGLVQPQFLPQEMGPHSVVVMDWISGQRIDAHVNDALEANQPHKVEALLKQLPLLVNNLRKKGMGFGDYQHGNMMIAGKGKSLKLIDYTSMFVPTLQGEDPIELGHDAYTHPYATRTYGLDQGNFQALIVYLSLLGRLHHPTLYKAGNEALYFTVEDLRDPLHSSRMTALRQSSNDETAALAQLVTELLQYNEDVTPALDEVLSLINSPNAPKKQTRKTRPKKQKEPVAVIAETVEPAIIELPPQAASQDLTSPITTHTPRMRIIRRWANNTAVRRMRIWQPQAQSNTPPLSEEAVLSQLTQALLQLGQKLQDPDVMQQIERFNRRILANKSDLFLIPVSENYRPGATGGMFYIDPVAQTVQLTLAGTDPNGAEQTACCQPMQFSTGLSDEQASQLASFVQKNLTLGAEPLTAAFLAENLFGLNSVLELLKK